MGVTLDEVKARLNEIDGMNPQPGPFPDSVGLLFPTKDYVSPIDGGSHILVLVVLEENGEYIKVMAPTAMKAEGRHADDFLKACMMIQWKVKLVQFEYDDSDGEIRPIVEWPVEDGTVTAKQLQRAVAGLVVIVDKYFPVLDKASKRGKIDFDLVPPTW